MDIQNLTFAYVENQPVLHDLSLTIPQGAFFGIVGHTGSGKSTLLSLLLRFYPVAQGSIAINGVALDSIDNEHFRADVGLVPQDPFLLAASARENIDMGAATRSSRSRRPPAPRMRTISSPRWNTATTRRWAKAARACHRGRSS